MASSIDRKNERLLYLTCTDVLQKITSVAPCSAAADTASAPSVCPQVSAPIICSSSPASCCINTLAASC